MIGRVLGVAALVIFAPGGIPIFLGVCTYKAGEWGYLKYVQFKARRIVKQELAKYPTVLQQPRGEA